MTHRLYRFGIIAGLAAGLGACADTPTDPSSNAEAVPQLSSSAVKFWESGSTVAWNRTARELMTARGVAAPQLQLRLLAYLSLAQYNAAVAAEDAKERGTHASPAVAIAGASVVVLKSFFPLDGGLIDSRLAEQLAATRWSGDKNRDAASGEAVGRAVGTAVLAYAAADNFNVASPPPAPGGLSQGYWVSATPVVRALYGARPFFLTSSDQFRSEPPPAFGSPAFAADLAEIRALSDNRTAGQLAEAQLWAARGAAFMNEVGVELIVEHKRSEREAAHVLALANMTGFDATIGCFDTKFAYWYIRPSQADPAITLPIGLPNHPSYISGHSCNTASYAAVLGHAFPTAVDRLADYVTRAGLSRMYGGLHYRFDITAGQKMGADVAAWAIANDVTGHEPFPLD